MFRRLKRWTKKSKYEWTANSPMPGELWYVKEARRVSDKVTYYFVVSCYPFCSLDLDQKIWEPAYTITLLWTSSAKDRPTAISLVYSVEEWHEALERVET